MIVRNILLLTISLAVLATVASAVLPPKNVLSCVVHNELTEPETITVSLITRCLDGLQEPVSFEVAHGQSYATEEQTSVIETATFSCPVHSLTIIGQTSHRTVTLTEPFDTDSPTAHFHFHVRSLGDNRRAEGNGPLVIQKRAE